jgi:hypothetical protein
MITTSGEKPETFGVIEGPKDLILRNSETIEWVITYRDEKSYHKTNSFLIHASTWEKAQAGFKKLFPTNRILKLEYYGTYQY